MPRTPGPKRKRRQTTTAAERLSAIAKHQRQVNGPLPSMDLTPRIRQFDLAVDGIAQQVRRLAAEWKFATHSICEEIERRAK